MTDVQKKREKHDDFMEEVDVSKNLDKWMYDNDMGHLTEHLHDKMQHHRARGERIRLRVE